MILILLMCLVSGGLLRVVWIRVNLLTGITRVALRGLCRVLALVLLLRRWIILICAWRLVLVLLRITLIICCVFGIRNAIRI